MISKTRWWHSRVLRVLVAISAFAALVLGVTVTIAPTAAGSVTAPAVSGLTPTDVQAAYRIPAQYTASELAPGLSAPTVAIVTAFDDPTAEADLAVYRARFGLPACTAATGCFTQIGATASRPAANAGWAAKTTLALDAASAACPQCHLVLVEAASARAGDVVNAVATAIARHPDALSINVDVAARPSTRTRLERILATARTSAGMSVPTTAPTGDTGYRSHGADWPAASRSVVAVGGTSLTHTSTGWTERAWNGAGSGCTTSGPRPAWQVGLVATAACAHRAVADLAAVADPATGLAVYDSYHAAGWARAGGTTLASTLVAAMYAMADANPVAVTRATTPVQWPYQYARHHHGGALYDVRSGANGTCGTGARAALCTAGRGWDGPTGLGSPRGLAALTPTGAFAATQTGSGAGIG